MTKLLEQAIEKVRLLPTDRQDVATRMLLTVAEQTDPDAPRRTDEQIAEVRRRRAERNHAIDEEVAAFFRFAGA